MYNFVEHCYNIIWTFDTLNLASSNEKTVHGWRSMMFVQPEQVFPRHQSTGLDDVIEIKTKASVTGFSDETLGLVLAVWHTGVWNVFGSYYIAKNPGYDII